MRATSRRTVPYGVEDNAVTPAGERAGESIEQRVQRELPDVEFGGDPDRSGRIVDKETGADGALRADGAGAEVGVDGGAAECRGGRRARPGRRDRAGRSRLTAPVGDPGGQRRTRKADTDHAEEAAADAEWDAVDDPDFGSRTARTPALVQAALPIRRAIASSRSRLSISSPRSTISSEACTKCASRSRSTSSAADPESDRISISTTLVAVDRRAAVDPDVADPARRGEAFDHEVAGDEPLDPAIGRSTDGERDGVGVLGAVRPAAHDRGGLPVQHGEDVLLDRIAGHDGGVPSSRGTALVIGGVSRDIAAGSSRALHRLTLFHPFDAQIHPLAVPQRAPVPYSGVWPPPPPRAHRR